MKLMKSRNLRKLRKSRNLRGGMRGGAAAGELGHFRLNPLRTASTTIHHDDDNMYQGYATVPLSANIPPKKETESIYMIRYQVGKAGGEEINPPFKFDTNKPEIMEFIKKFNIDKKSVKKFGRHPHANTQHIQIPTFVEKDFSKLKVFENKFIFISFHDNNNNKKFNDGKG